MLIHVWGITPLARQNYLFTSESVSEGHPDKVCDRISDAVLDAYLTVDPQARVACETLATTNRVVIAGEVRGPHTVLEGIDDIVRECVRDIGYDQQGFSWKTLDVSCHLHEQSAHIAQGVDSNGDKDEGAGDQGIMFGFATDETPELMPAPVHYAHRMLKRLAEVRKSGEAPQLGPDAKSQLTVRYEGGRPVGITSLVLSTQHIDDSMTSADVRALVQPYIEQVLPEGWLTADTEWHVNPTGKFVIGGPDGDAGLTGRKIIVDTYGGAAPHGGGAFSGKDPTKVDRSAAYASRYLAKNVVAAGLAQKCVIQLSYAIGVSRPLSIYADTFGTGQVSEEAIERAVAQAMDLTPRGIREHLGLNRPIYQRTAAYGHFGRAPEADGGFSWEKTDLADALRAAMVSPSSDRGAPRRPARRAAAFLKGIAACPEAPPGQETAA
jgi:S-adenosylmethionine synthetase